MVVSPQPNIAWAGVLLVLANIILLSGTGLFPTLAIVIGQCLLTWGAHRDYDLGDLLVLESISAGLGAISINMIYTSVGWYQSTQQKANLLLEEARKHRGELSVIVKNLTQVNGILRKTQQDLVYARMKADEARRAKELFAANISHELRTPLNLVLGFSEVMYQSPEVYGEMVVPAAFRRDIYQIYRSSRHLLGMINDILDLSKVDRSGATLNFERLSMTALLGEAAAMAGDLFIKPGLRFEVSIPSDLPILEIDPTRIRQVVLNLLNNAQRFTSEGKVTLSAWQEEGKVIVNVQDTGPGISPEKVEHIFDEFYQADQSLHRSNGGVGLGLAICKHFVEAHGGQIWVETRVGEGSSFFFSLPIRHPVWLELPEQTNRLPDYSKNAERDKVLIVDPDPLFAESFDRQLEHVEVVRIPGEADLTWSLEKYQPKLIVWNHPISHTIMNTHLDFGVPVLHCGLPSRAFSSDYQGVTSYLIKPVTKETLLAELKRHPAVTSLMVIDDERGFVQLVDRMISVMILEGTIPSLKMMHAFTGEEGMEKIRMQKPDVVLLDQVLPDRSGLAVLKEIRSDPELMDLPVVLTTASEHTESDLNDFSPYLYLECSGERAIQTTRFALGQLAAALVNF